MKKVYITFLLLSLFLFISCIFNTSSREIYYYDLLDNKDSIRLEAHISSPVKSFNIILKSKIFSEIESISIYSKDKGYLEMSYANKISNRIYYIKKFVFSNREFKEIFEDDTVRVKITTQSNNTYLRFRKLKSNN